MIHWSAFPAMNTNAELDRNTGQGYITILLPGNLYTPDKCIYMRSHSLLKSKLSISCKRYNVNLQTAVVAILVFVECPKSIASEVVVVFRSYQNMKSIRQAVFKISRSKAIVDGQAYQNVRLSLL